MNQAQSMVKRLCFWIVALLPFMILLELTSYIVINNYIPSRIRARLLRGTIGYHIAQRPRARLYQPQFIRKPDNVHSPMADESSGLMMFNPRLGWDYPPRVIYRDIDGITYSHGPGGERITCTSYGTSLISTYGDSFTYGTGVRDRETWQTFLGNNLGTNVLNFGVAGYGTDQACLKYETNRDVNTRVVMLCIWPENINRVVNIYRPFLYHEERLGLTKPLFMRKGNQFKLIHNPLTKASQVKKLDDPAFLKRIARQDYWYKLDKRLPGISFPFTLSLVRWLKPIFQKLVLSASKVLPYAVDLKYPWNLFDEPGPFGVMCHVIDRFVKTARSRGSVPVVVILPHKDQVRELLDYHTSRVEPLTRYLDEKRCAYIDVLQQIADMNPTLAQLEEWFQGHSTKEGDEVIAEILGHDLRRICPEVFVYRVAEKPIRNRPFGFPHRFPVPPNGNPGHPPLAGILQEHRSGIVRWLTDSGVPAQESCRGAVLPTPVKPPDGP